MKEERICWIDLSKLVGILFIIAGHTIIYPDYGTYIRSLIFSFHVPLFFILSGYTSKLPTTKSAFLNMTKKRIASLVLPAYCTYIFHVLFQLLLSADKTNILNKNYIFNQFFSTIFTSVKTINSDSITTYSFGYLWFLICLFITHLILNYLSLFLNTKTLLLCSLMFSLIGFQISRYSILPFCLDIALTVAPLYMLGIYFKKNNLPCKKNCCVFIFFFIWILSWRLITFTSPLDVAKRIYPLFPLCFIPAVSGSLFVIYICKFCPKNKIIYSISKLGRYSLWLLLIHDLDFIWENLWHFTYNQYIHAFLRISTDLLVFILLFMTIKKFRSHKSDGT